MPERSNAWPKRRQKPPSNAKPAKTQARAATRAWPKRRRRRLSTKPAKVSVRRSAAKPAKAKCGKGCRPVSMADVKAGRASRADRTESRAADAAQRQSRGAWRPSRSPSPVVRKIGRSRRRDARGSAAGRRLHAAGRRPFQEPASTTSRVRRPRRPSSRAGFRCSGSKSTTPRRRRGCRPDGHFRQPRSNSTWFLNHSFIARGASSTFRAEARCARGQAMAEKSTFVDIIQEATRQRWRRSVARARNPPLRNSLAGRPLAAAASGRVAARAVEALEGQGLASLARPVVA